MISEHTLVHVYILGAYPVSFCKIPQKYRYNKYGIVHFVFKKYKVENLDVHVCMTLQLFGETQV